MGDLLTVNETAALLGVTRQRVHAMIQAQRLPAQTYGRMKLIRAEDVARVRERTRGRPRKETTAMITGITVKYTDLFENVDINGIDQDASTARFIDHLTRALQDAYPGVEIDVDVDTTTFGEVRVILHGTEATWEEHKEDEKATDAVSAICEHVYGNGEGWIVEEPVAPAIP